MTIVVRANGRITMQLIDGDEFSVFSWTAQGSEEYKNGFDDGVNFVVDKIDAAPTVDAIPVEWITARWKNWYWDSVRCECERFLIEDWQKEQEAR